MAGLLGSPSWSGARRWRRRCATATRVLARRGGRPIRAGDVVVARFRSRPDLLVVKRAVRPDGSAAGGCAGDNEFVTDDSRAYGSADVEARVCCGTGPAPYGGCDVRVTGVAPRYASRRCCDAEHWTRDPVFDLHRGGKMAVAVHRAAVQPGGSLARVHPRRRPGLRGHRRRSRRSPATTPGSATPSRWSPTARPCSGLGNIGPRAAMPVMEGKAVLFKQFGGVDAVPICLDTQDTEEIIRDRHRARARASAGSTWRTSRRPRCFEIERRLDEALDIPVFHDDQHGTAIVVLAALRNAATLLGPQARPTCASWSAAPARPASR